MTPRLRALLIDGAIAALLMAAATAMALQYIRAQPPRPYFFDWELVPVTVMACGHGFAQPALPIPELTEFVARRSATFDCAVLDAAPPVIRAASLPNANRYGLYGPALSMALLGPTWATLDRYVASLFGLAMGLTFALLRLVSMRGIAVLGTLVLACSSKLQELPSHRDYIKEPPFLAVLVVMAWFVIRERSRRGIWTAAAVGGLLLGIGIGCRADLMIMGPFFAASLVLFARWAPGQGTMCNRVAALAIFAAGFAVTATPILRTLSGGSNLSHTVLMGFMTPFTEHLGLTVPAYDVGSIYADGYTYNMIAVQARIRERDMGPVPFGQPEYDRAGARLWGDIARQFPADMLARGYGAVLQALEYPTTHQAIYEAKGLAGFAASPVLARMAAWRFQVFERLEGKGAWFTGVALVIVAAVNPRMAIFSLLAVSYFCAYSMLQFSRRHTFHLDVFSVVAAMFLLQVIVVLGLQIIRRRAPLPIEPRAWAVRAGAFVAVIGLTAAGPLAALRWYQQSHVQQVIDTTIAAVRTPVPFTTTPVGDDGTLIAGPQLGERNGPGPIDDVRDVRMEYLVAEFSGPGCGTDPFPVASLYTGVVKTLDKEFNRTMTVVPPPAGGTFRLLSPAFYEYGPYWLRFDGLVVPAARTSCLTALSRADRPGDLPFPFLFARLGPGWRGEPLFQRFSWE